ncbi:MAG: GlcG/HbpS family heme-binding protein [Steroidobacteraceae bacterium]
MQPRYSVDADDIKAALDVAQAEAGKNHWEVSIAAVDDGGHLLGFLRLTGAAPLSARIAVEKARTAALSRRESKFYEEIVKNGRNAFLSVPDLTVLEGGVPVFVAGHCVAAIGVSGVKSDQDAQVALAGVKALLARQKQP